MEINISINEGCKHCKKALKYFEFLKKKHPELYANMNMKSYEFIEPMVLSPDFNSCGYLTHFHIEKANVEGLLKFADLMKKQKSDAKKLVKLKRSKKWITRDSQ